MTRGFVRYRGCWLLVLCCAWLVPGVVMGQVRHSERPVIFLWRKTGIGSDFGVPCYVWRTNPNAEDIQWWDMPVGGVFSRTTSGEWRGSVTETSSLVKWPIYEMRGGIVDIPVRVRIRTVTSPPNSKPQNSYHHDVMRVQLWLWSATHLRGRVNLVDHGWSENFYLYPNTVLDSGMVTSESLTMLTGTGMTGAFPSVSDGLVREVFPNYGGVAPGAEIYESGTSGVVTWTVHPFERVQMAVSGGWWHLPVHPDAPEWPMWKSVGDDDGELMEKPSVAAVPDPVVSYPGIGTSGWSYEMAMYTGLEAGSVDTLPLFDGIAEIDFDRYVTGDGKPIIDAMLIGLCGYWAFLRVMRELQKGRIHAI